jgi:epoxyqueuosine reductase QueG
MGPATALDEAAWDAFARRSAIRRAGRAGFVRNMCVELGNWGAPEALPSAKGTSLRGLPSGRGELQAHSAGSAEEQRPGP